jgi:DNA-binding ferritin-like protein
MNSTMAALISLLLSSRNQSHIFHLQTESYAQHKALNEYYDEIIDFIDGMVESYQGKYGILSGYTGTSTIMENASTTTMIEYFTKLGETVAEARKEIPQDDYLLNQVDEITALVYSTVYKLKFLK